MELINSLHAVAGFVVAIFGLLQIFMKKGGAAHAMIGFTYLIAWIFVLFSGLFMGQTLMSFIGAFGFYMAFSGWRYASRRRKHAKLIDKIIAVLGLAIGFWTLVWSIILAFSADLEGWIGLALGVFFLFVTVLDILEMIYKKKIRKTATERRHWMFEHMTRMYISYIAAMTVFMVINGVFFEPIYNWVLPISLGIPFIIISRRFQAAKLIAKEESDRS